MPFGSRSGVSENTHRPCGGGGARDRHGPLRRCWYTQTSAASRPRRCDWNTSARPGHQRHRVTGAHTTTASGNSMFSIGGCVCVCRRSVWVHVCVNASVPSCYAPSNGRLAAECLAFRYRANGRRGFLRNNMGRTTHTHGQPQRSGAMH